MAAARPGGSSSWSPTPPAGLLRRTAAANHGHAPADVLAAAAVSDQEMAARFHIVRPVNESPGRFRYITSAVKRVGWAEEDRYLACTRPGWQFDLLKGG